MALSKRVQHAVGQMSRELQADEQKASLECDLTHPEVEETMVTLRRCFVDLSNQDVPSHISDTDTESIEESPGADDVVWLQALKDTEFEETFGASNKYVQALDTKEKVAFVNLYEENQKYKIDKLSPVFIKKGEALKWRHRCIKYYMAELRSGYYTGFMCTWRCIVCNHVHSSHPSPYKVIYWINESKCCYCVGKKIPMEMREAETVRAVANAFAVKNKKYHFKPYHHFYVHDF